MHAQARAMYVWTLLTTSPRVFSLCCGLRSALLQPDKAEVCLAPRRVHTHLPTFAMLNRPCSMYDIYDSEFSTNNTAVITLQTALLISASLLFKTLTSDSKSCNATYTDKI